MPGSSSYKDETTALPSIAHGPVEDMRDQVTKMHSGVSVVMEVSVGC